MTRELTRLQDALLRALFTAKKERHLLMRKGAFGNAGIKSSELNISEQLIATIYVFESRFKKDFFDLNNRIEANKFQRLCTKTFKSLENKGYFSIINKEHKVILTNKAKYRYYFKN